MAWTILVEGHQRNILTKYIKIGPVISDKKRFKIFYIDLLGKNALPMAAPFFLTSHDGLNNLVRRLPRK